MKQSKAQSLIESLTNTGVGVVISLVANAIIMPMVGLPISVTQNITITVIYTIISVTRSYIVRRYFTHLKR